MVSILTLNRIDLVWADEQYWTTLLKVFKSITNISKPKEKRKVSASELNQFIR